MSKIRRDIKQEPGGKETSPRTRGTLSRRIRDLLPFIKPVVSNPETNEEDTTGQSDISEETTTTENANNNGSTTGTDPGSGTTSSPTSSDMEPFIGEIRMFVGNYAPTGWAFCEGQPLNVSNYTALFSIIGNTYGGNGTTTFALPDLRGRVPLHPGQGPGLSGYTPGQSGGQETVALDINQIPAHNHSVNSFTGPADSSDPSNKMMAHSEQAIYGSGNQTSSMSSQMTGNTGSSMAHTNMQPYLAINFIIALNGIYPPRS